MGTRTGNPAWQNNEAGGTPISGAALQAIEDAIDHSPTLGPDGKVLASQLPPSSGGGSGSIVRRANGAGVYPARGTADQVLVQWIGPTQPTIAAPGSSTDWVGTATAMAGYDFWDRAI